MGSQKNERQKVTTDRSGDNADLDFESLVGKTIDPTRLEKISWSVEETDDGHMISGVLARSERLGQAELLRAGVFDFGGGPGMPVTLRVDIQTNGAFVIKDIDVEAYASYGSSQGRPISVEVTEEDEALIASEIGRLLTIPRLSGGRITEDQEWLKELLPRFEELTHGDILHLEKELGRYNGKKVNFDLAKRNGWELHSGQTGCSGHIELITDCEGHIFWMGLLLLVDPNHVVVSAKGVLSETSPPSQETILEEDCHMMVEGFNLARIKKVLDKVTGPSGA